MPYHSRKTLGVHHTYTDCVDGNNIEKRWRKNGTGGLPKCKRCAARSERRHPGDTLEAIVQEMKRGR